MMSQSECLVINPKRVNNFVAHFNCMPVNRASDYIREPKATNFSCLELDLKVSFVAWSTWAQLMSIFCFSLSVVFDFKTCSYLYILDIMLYKAVIEFKP